MLTLLFGLVGILTIIAMIKGVFDSSHVIKAPDLKDYLKEHPNCKTKSGIKCCHCNSGSLRNVGLRNPADKHRLISCNSCGTSLYKLTSVTSRDESPVEIESERKIFSKEFNEKWGALVKYDAELREVLNYVFSNVKEKKNKAIIVDELKTAYEIKQEIKPLKAISEGLVLEYLESGTVTV